MCWRIRRALFFSRFPEARYAAHLAAFRPTFRPFFEFLEAMTYLLSVHHAPTNELSCLLLFKMAKRRGVEPRMVGFGIQPVRRHAQYNGSRGRIRTYIVPINSRRSYQLDRTRNRWSARRGSDPRPSTWQADVLPAELRTLKYGGGDRIRTDDLQGMNLAGTTGLPYTASKFSLPFFKMVAETRIEPVCHAL